MFKCVQRFAHTFNIISICIYDAFAWTLDLNCQFDVKTLHPKTRTRNFHFRTFYKQGNAHRTRVYIFGFFYFFPPTHCFRKAFAIISHSQRRTTFVRCRLVSNRFVRAPLFGSRQYYSLSARLTWIQQYLRRETVGVHRPLSCTISIFDKFQHSNRSRSSGDAGTVLGKWHLALIENRLRKLLLFRINFVSTNRMGIGSK